MHAVALSEDCAIAQKSAAISNYAGLKIWFHGEYFPRFWLLRISSSNFCCQQSNTVNRGFSVGFLGLRVLY